MPDPSRQSLQNHTVMKVNVFYHPKDGYALAITALEVVDGSPIECGSVTVEKSGLEPNSDAFSSPIVGHIAHVNDANGGFSAKILDVSKFVSAGDQEYSEEQDPNLQHSQGHE